MHRLAGRARKPAALIRVEPRRGTHQRVADDAAELSDARGGRTAAAGRRRVLSVIRIIIFIVLFTRVRVRWGNNGHQLSANA